MLHRASVLALLGACLTVSVGSAQGDIAWNFDNVAAGTASAAPSSSNAILAGSVSSTSTAGMVTAGGGGSAPHLFRVPVGIPGVLFPYVRLTTSAPVRLDELTLLATHNDPSPSWDMIVEISPEGAPEPTGADPGTGYSEFGRFDLATSVWQTVSARGAHFLSAGTYNIRFRPTTPLLVGTSQLFFDDLRLGVTCSNRTTWSFDDVALGADRAPVTATAPRSAAVVASTAPQSEIWRGSPVSSPQFYRVADANESTRFPYVRYTSAVPVQLTALSLVGGVNDAVSFWDFAVEVSPEGAPEPTEAAPGTGYRSFGTFSLANAAWGSARAEGAMYLPAGTHIIRMRPMRPPVQPVGVCYFDDLELVVTEAPPRLMFDFDDAALGVRQVDDSASSGFTGIFSSTSTGGQTISNSTGSAPQAYASPVGVPAQLFPYARFTTDRAVVLEKVSLLVTENDPRAELDVAIEISSEGAPEPTSANPGASYTAFGAFRVQSGPFQRRTVYGSHVLAAGTYNIRLRVTTAASLGTSQLFLDDVVFELVEATDRIAFDFDNVAAGLRDVPASQAAPFLSATLSSTTGGSMTETGGGGSAPNFYRTPHLDPTSVFPFVRFTTTEPVRLDSVQMAAVQNDTLPSWPMSIEVSPEGAPVPTAANPGADYRSFGDFSVGNSWRTHKVSGSAVLLPGTYNLRIRVTTQPNVWTSQLFLDDLTLRFRPFVGGIENTWPSTCSAPGLDFEVSGTPSLGDRFEARVSGTTGVALVALWIAPPSPLPLPGCQCLTLELGSFFALPSVAIRVPVDPSFRGATIYTQGADLSTTSTSSGCSLGGVRIAFSDVWTVVLD